jgi:iron(III) transport system permease protein
VTLGAVAIGVPLAWLTVRTDLPWRRFWSIALVLPLVVPTYVGAFTYVAALGPRGMLQQILAGPLGVQRLPEIYGFGGAVIVLILFTYPYVILTMQGALVRLDAAFEDASRSLGVGPWQSFFRVTLPLLRPSIAAGALLVALYALSDFGVVSLLQFDSFTRAIYVQYQGSLDRNAAAVLALLLVGLTGFVLLLDAASRGRARYYRSASGVTQEPRLLRLGHLRPVALGFCVVVFFFAVALPVGVLLYWLARGLASMGVFVGVWTAAFNSVVASGLSALVAIVAAFPVAILAVRYPSRLTSLLERVTYSAFALPGIVVALALVFFGANYAPLVYQTLALLIVGYMIRFLPEAVGALRSGLLQVNPRLEEAARSLGRSPRQVLVTVTAPLVWPSVLAGAALVFMSTMKELPTTLLLSPTGFKTLATATWGAASEGFYSQAAVFSLIIVAVSAATLPLLLRTERPENGGQGG